jgi:hypothetical protein
LSAYRFFDPSLEFGACVVRQAADEFVYISYAGDAEFATKLASGLLSKKIPVWIATQNIVVGENWRDAQVRAVYRLVVLDDQMLDRHVLRTEIFFAEARAIDDFWFSRHGSPRTWKAG